MFDGHFQGFTKGKKKDKFANRFANSRCKPPGAGQYVPPPSLNPPSNDEDEADFENPFKNTGW